MSRKMATGTPRKKRRIQAVSHREGVYLREKGRPGNVPAWRRWTRLRPGRITVNGWVPGTARRSPRKPKEKR